MGRPVVNDGDNPSTQHQRKPPVQRDVIDFVGFVIFWGGPANQEAQKPLSISYYDYELVHVSSVQADFRAMGRGKKAKGRRQRRAAASAARSNKADSHSSGSTDGQHRNGGFAAPRPDDLRSQRHFSARGVKTGTSSGVGKNSDKVRIQLCLQAYISVAAAFFVLRVAVLNSLSPVHFFFVVGSTACQALWDATRIKTAIKSISNELVVPTISAVVSAMRLRIICNTTNEIHTGVVILFWHSLRTLFLVAFYGAIPVIFLGYIYSRRLYPGAILRYGRITFGAHLENVWRAFQGIFIGHQIGLSSFALSLCGTLPEWILLFYNTGIQIEWKSQEDYFLSAVERNNATASMDRVHMALVIWASCDFFLALRTASTWACDGHIRAAIAINTATNEAVLSIASLALSIFVLCEFSKTSDGGIPVVMFQMLDYLLFAFYVVGTLISIPITLLFGLFLLLKKRRSCRNYIREKITKAAESWRCTPLTNLIGPVLLLLAVCSALSEDFLLFLQISHCTRSILRTSANEYLLSSWQPAFRQCCLEGSFSSVSLNVLYLTLVARSLYDYCVALVGALPIIEGVAFHIVDISQDDGQYSTCMDERESREGSTGTQEEESRDTSSTLDIQQAAGQITRPSGQCRPCSRQQLPAKPKPITTCGGCGAVLSGKPRKICKGCLTQTYCDRSCQKIHWNKKEASHREECEQLRSQKMAKETSM